MALDADDENLLARSAETADVDFKSAFDTESPGEWIELVKDIVAMANSGGGCIVVGLNDDGSPSRADVSRLIEVDPADLTNKIYKYTGTNFHAFAITACVKADAPVCVIRIAGVGIPLVFNKVGTYETTNGKQKNAFSLGTVYFRHGAKSEPATSDDLRQFLEREVEAVRRSWLDGIAKVVDAPVGARIVVVPQEVPPPSAPGTAGIRLVTDASATPYYALPLDDTHPYRQKEVVRAVNARIGDRRKVNSHDILCVRRVHNVASDPTLCFTQKYATARYTQRFVDWIVEEFERSSSFFDDSRKAFEQSGRRGA